MDWAYELPPSNPWSDSTQPVLGSDHEFPKVQDPIFEAFKVVMIGSRTAEERTADHDPEILGITGEYLALVRRWREGQLSASDPDLDRLRDLRRQIEMIIGSMRHPDSPDRMALRVPTEIFVGVYSASVVERGLLCSVSELGAHLTSPTLLPQGQSIEIEILSRSVSSPIRLTGVVVWSRSARGTTSAEIGIQFRALSDDTIGKLGHIMDDALIARVSSQAGVTMSHPE